MKLTVETSTARIADPSREARTAIRKACTYEEAGAEFLRRKTGMPWLGKVCLAKDEGAGIRFPVGMLRDVLRVLQKRQVAVTVEDKRTTPKRIDTLRWNEEIVPRPHQIASCDAVMRPGLYYGTGTIKAPIRSGKTITAALIIYRMRMRTVFVVPSKELVRQATAALKRALGCDIGVCSEGTWTIRDVNVASVQALCAAKKTRPKDYAKLMERCDLVIVDEVHHMTGRQWNKAVEGLQSRYRIGLSATAYFTERSEIERGIMWVRSLCGGIVHDVSISDMIEAGYLVAPDIYLHDIREPKCRGMQWGEQLKRIAIVENEGRNRQIVRLAMKHAAAGSRVLIIANRIAHIEALHAMVEAAGSPCGMAIGKTTTDERNAHLERLINGEAPIVVANVFGEGVDLPAVDVVINAEGGKDPKQAMQRMRNLTACAGKSHAIFHDFYDRTSRHLQEHAEERLRLYRSERAFRVHFNDELRGTPCTATSAPCPF